MTRDDVREACRALGLTCRMRDGEYRINFRALDGGREATAYYTSDADDAIATAHAMAARGTPMPRGKPMSRVIHLLCSRAQANWGYSDSSRSYNYRDCLCSDDGIVRAWDDIGDLYSTIHDLTPTQEARVRAAAEAGKEWA